MSHRMSHRRYRIRETRASEELSSWLIFMTETMVKPRMNEEDPCLCTCLTARAYGRRSGRTEVPSLTGELDTVLPVLSPKATVPEKSILPEKSLGASRPGDRLSSLYGMVGVVRNGQGGDLLNHAALTVSVENPPLAAQSQT